MTEYVYSVAALQTGNFTGTVCIGQHLHRITLNLGDIADTYCRRRAHQAFNRMGVMIADSRRNALAHLPPRTRFRHRSIDDKCGIGKTGNHFLITDQIAQ